MEVYPKFKEGKDCAFPERKNCNYDKFDIKSKRCPFMKFVSLGNWKCEYNKSSKTELSKEQSPIGTKKEVRKV